MSEFHPQRSKWPGQFWHRCLLLLALGGWLGASSVKGEEKYSEHAVKAAFVVNFINFVEWPATTNAPATNHVVLGAYGGEKYLEALEIAARQSVTRAGKIIVRKLTEPRDAAACDLIFIAADVDAAPLVGALKSAPVLTISDGSHFAEHGGIIELVTVGQNLRFDINLGAGQQAGLKISSQILRLARRILPPPAKSGR